MFAQEKFAGNQLAVVTNASKLSEEVMQKIANEFHFSETAFIISHSTKGYAIRIFTPSKEVPFAGYPTLGTAYVIRNYIEKQIVQQLKLILKVGQITVFFNGEIVWMQQKPPVFGKIFSLKFFKEVLNLSGSDFDPAYQIQCVSTGLPFIIVPLKTLDSIKKAKINYNVLPKLIKMFEAGILLFCPQTYSKINKLNVRVFVDAFGTPEDPATGSGNGCLAAYLSKHLYFGKSEIELSVEQGHEINRSSILHLKTRTKDDNLLIEVGGQVRLVAKGELMGALTTFE